MANQSIFGQLVSSIVRQVGRDTGKVISNQLYGDAHSTPVRHVRSERTQTSLPNPKSVKRIMEEQRSGTYKPYTPTSTPKTYLTNAKSRQSSEPDKSEWQGFGCILVAVFIGVFLVVLLLNLIVG